MELLLPFDHLGLQTLVAASLQGVYLGIELTLDGRIALLKIECDVETSSTETSPKDKIEEVSPSVGNSNTEETPPVKKGHFAIS